MRPGPQPAGAEELLSWLAGEKGRSANTVAAYRRDLAAYGRFLSGRGLAPAEVTETVVEDYLGVLRATGRAPASVARALVSVRALHRFLETEGRATGNPAGHVGPPRVAAGPPWALSEQEASRLLEAVVGDDATTRRDRAIVEVLYACGLRVSELVGLSLGDVDLDGGLLRVGGGDGPAAARGRERVVPVEGPAAAALVAWLSPSGRGALAPVRWARRGDADAVFLNARGGRLSRQGAWRIVNHYGEKVGLAGRLTPHVLRHSCATHMIDHGADIRVVQELLGHASMSSTQAYTRGSTDRLRRAYRSAHPRAGDEKPR
ncbi:MAG: tyrosine-type recombinase/integrase [Acidimicrobiales bacterium]